MLPNKRHGVVLTVGLALLALAFVGTAAADPGVSVSADGDAVEVEAEGDNGSLACTFATDVEENEEPCEAEGPAELPEDDGGDGDDAEFDPNVDATVGPDGAEAEASAGEGELQCELAPPEEDEEPAPPCEGTAPGQEQLPEDEGDDDGDDGESSNLEFQGSVGEDGLYLTVGDGTDGVTCALGPDYEGEEPPCQQLGDDGDDGGEESPQPPEQPPEPPEEPPTDEVLTEDLLLDHFAS